MLEHTIKIEIAVLFAFATCYYIYQSILEARKRPAFAISGAKPGDWFPRLQAKIRNTMDGRKAVFLAYEHFREEPCYLPSFGALKGQVVLPLQWIRHILAQPDHVLDLYEIGKEALQFDRVFFDKRFSNPPLHLDLVIKDLTKNIVNLMPTMAIETEFGFTEQWGRPEEWSTVTVYDTVQQILGLVTNRVTYGLPISRDPKLRKQTMEFIHRAFVEGSMVHILWKPLRPFLRPLILLPLWLSMRKFRNLILPEVQKRQAEQKGLETKGTDQPNDFLQWAINQAKELKDPYFSKPEVVANRALFMNYVSIHTSTFTLTHAILDLASAGPEVQEELRQEVISVLGSSNGEWSKKAFAKMVKVDSVLRESAGLNTLVCLSGTRLVLAPEGLELPNGMTVLQGTPISFQAAPIMENEDIYSRANEFQPFRFVSKAKNDKADAQEESRARTAFACTSPTYMAFGHGKHACIGRFFASAELKLMLAHIVLHYELEKIERPLGKWYGMVRVPPMTAKLKIRTRRHMEV